MARKTICGCYSCAVVVVINSWLWLIEYWGVVTVRHAAILVLKVQWRVVALLNGGSEGRPTNLDSSVLFCESNSWVMSVTRIKVFLTNNLNCRPGEGLGLGVGEG